MKLFGLDITIARKDAAMSIDTVMARLMAAHDSIAGVNVNPENCMQSPTVNAIVTAIARRIATLPVHVLQKKQGKSSKDRARTELKPNHPVQKLLQMPNDWQDRVTFWLDATSQLVRYGNSYHYKSRGQTGPIRKLYPLHAGAVTVEQDIETLAVTYRATLSQGRGQRDYAPSEIMHARTAARDMLRGDSPVNDIHEAIGLDIAAERMGAAVFGNGAMPSLVFEHEPGSKGFKTDEEEKKFIDGFQDVYAKQGRFKSMILPKGMKVNQPLAVENEKAQFLQTRQYQRSVIAGAFGVPPHMVGDLSRGTFNNVEQQSLDFVINTVLPYVRVFEAAMERALMTDEDRRDGMIIRFNLEGALRGSFKDRQEGLKIQREMGVINANDWREVENMNPRDDEGGEMFWDKGPSGQGQDAPPADPAEPDAQEQPGTQDQEGEQ